VQLLRGVENIFIRDLATGTITALTTDGAASAVPSFSASGNRVAYVAAAQFGSPVYPLVVRELPNLSLVYSNSFTNVTACTLSPDGQTVALAAEKMYLLNLASGSREVIHEFAASDTPPRFTADGRYLTFSAPAAEAPVPRQVWLRDFQGATNVLVSTALGSAQPGNGHSRYPEISPDGRLIAYRTWATDVLSCDTNTLGDLVVYDIASRVNMAVTGEGGECPPDAVTASPVFRPDSQALYFFSWASDFYKFDFNQASDLFRLSLAFAPAPGFKLQVSLVPGPAPSVRLTWQTVSGQTYRALRGAMSTGGWVEASAP
jgi:Tol biopolymer transport system component